MLNRWEWLRIRIECTTTFPLWLKELKYFGFFKLINLITSYVNGPLKSFPNDVLYSFPAQDSFLAFLITFCTRCLLVHYRTCKLKLVFKMMLEDLRAPSSQHLFENFTRRPLFSSRTVTKAWRTEGRAASTSNFYKIIFCST